MQLFSPRVAEACDVVLPTLSPKSSKIGYSIVPKCQDHSRQAASQHGSFRALSKIHQRCSKGGDLGEAPHIRRRRMGTILQTLTQRPQVSASRCSLNISIWKLNIAKPTMSDPTATGQCKPMHRTSTWRSNNVELIDAGEPCRLACLPSLPSCLQLLWD